MRKLRWVLFVFLVLACSTAVWAAIVTLRFDELPFQPVDGLSFSGVTFGFTVAGVPSTDAHYNSFGPGIITYVQDPSLEGDATGTLSLDFDVPTPVLQFGVAISATGAFARGFSVNYRLANVAGLGASFSSQAWAFTLHGAPPVLSAIAGGMGVGHPHICTLLDIPTEAARFSPTRFP